MNTSVVASSASSRVGRARRQNPANRRNTDQPNKYVPILGVIPQNKSGSGLHSWERPSRSLCFELGTGLEHKLYGKLDASLAAPSPDRVSQANVRRLRELVESYAST